MSLLITGGCGFLGLNLTKYLLGLGERIVLFDVKGEIPQYFGGIGDSDRVTVVKGDVLDYGKLLETLLRHQVQVVVHTAAIWGEGFCRDEPLKSVKTNILGAAHVLELARCLGIRRSILISSRSAYGEYKPEEGPTGENHLPRPVGFYGAAKAAVDLLCKSYRKQFGLDTVALRPTGIYGPGWTFATPIKQFVGKALTSEKLIMKEGGEYLYEFNYVEDVVRGIDLVRKAKSTQYGVYNLGSGKQYTLIEVAEAVKKHIPEFEFEIGPGYPKGIAPRAAMDVRRFEGEFGYCSKTSLEEGVAKYVIWARGPGKEFFLKDVGQDPLGYSRRPDRGRGENK